jgi:hypothetical protein
MAQRLAGTVSLVVFVTCLLIGAFSAQNPLPTVVGRALVAMAGTFVVALVIGLMAKRMLDENLRSVSSAPSPTKAQENLESNSPPSDR